MSLLTKIKYFFDGAEEAEESGLILSRRKFFIGTAALIIAPTVLEAVTPKLITLKSSIAKIHYGLFDLEVEQDGQFSYLEAMDITEAIDIVLKRHDENLWMDAYAYSKINTVR